MKHILTLDIEGWYQSSLDILGPEHANVKRPVPPDERVMPNVRRVLFILAEYNVRVTCFVLGTVAETYPDLVREIHSAGHEVATHGYAHDLVYQLTPTQFRADLLRSIELLETITGERVRGYRAPYFSITRGSEWALEVLADSGVDYDSSIFPIRRKLYGFPGHEAFPHRLHLGGARELVELPISTVSLLGMSLPVGGGGYLRLLPARALNWAIRRIETLGQPAVLYLHPYELDTAALREPLTTDESFKTSRARWIQRLGRATVEIKLRQLLERFEFVAVEEWLEEHLEL